MNNIKLLLPAYAKKQLSDSGGRQVVDKMFDVSLNRRIVEWSGTDRPEYTDLDGISKVCVEAGRTNSILDSRDMTAGSWAPGGPNGATVERNAVGIFGDANAACTITGQGDVNDRVFANISVQDDTATHCGSVYVRKGAGVVRFYTYVFGGTQVTASSVLNTSTGEVSGPGVVEDWGGWWRIWQTVTNNGTGNTSYQMRLYPDQQSPYTGSAIFDQAQIELNAAYPTLPIITSGAPVTRLTPTVQITDALPLTGTVAGKVDMVRTVGLHQYVFDTEGNSAVDRSWLRISDIGNLQARIYGGTDTGLSPISVSFPFDIPNGQRFDLHFAISWGEDTVRLFVMSGEEQYLYDSDLQIIDNSRRDIYLGARTAVNQRSTRFLIPWHKDTIVRTTEEEFEQLFETIS